MTKKTKRRILITVLVILGILLIFLLFKFVLIPLFLWIWGKFIYFFGILVLVVIALWAINN